MKLSRQGFTLLECLVVTAITAVIASAMTAITLRTLHAWGAAEAEQAQAVIAEQVFTQLGRDLSALHGATDGSTCFALDVLDSPTALANHGWRFDATPMKPGNGGSLRALPSTDESSLDAARFGLSGAWLRFLTTNLESGGGVPVVVAYQVVRRPVFGNPVTANPAPVRYGLYRSAVSASETFIGGSDVTATVYTSSTNTPSSALSAVYRQARNVMNPSHANLLAPNVVDFGCWLYARDAAGNLTRIYPADANDVSHRATFAGTNGSNRLPDVVDVMLRVLSPTGVAAIAAIERGEVARPADQATNATWWWSVAESHSRVFSRRFEVARSP